jgi:hypothetical protein
VRVATLALLLAAALVRLFGHGEQRRTLAHLVDFNAFYCAGSDLIAGRDPYLAEPLRSCEDGAALAGGTQLPRLVAMPAPLPGYALAFFALFARLPLSYAAAMYTILLVASLAFTTLLLEKLTRFPRLGILAALVLCDGWVSLGYGQIVALTVMLLCAAALAVAHNRPVTAACCAAAAMIEPHVALPACIALFAFAGRTRVPLLAGAAVLAAISVQATGWHTNCEYFTNVLSAHALAESNDIGQFSLTTLLHRLGVDAPAALAFADLSYAATLGLGIFVAGRLAARAAAPELLVVVPPAFTLLGGPFLHTSQMAVAVPALLVLLYRFPERRTLLSTALVIMAIPWQELAENPLAAGLVAVALTTAGIAVFVLAAKPARTLVLVAATAAAAAFERCVRTAYPPLHVNLSRELLQAASGSLPADATWAIHARSIVSVQWYIASHVPAWTGLLLTIAVASSLTFNPATFSDRRRRVLERNSSGGHSPC